VLIGEAGVGKTGDCRGPQPAHCEWRCARRTEKQADYRADMGALVAGPSFARIRGTAQGSLKEVCRLRWRDYPFLDELHILSLALVLPKSAMDASNMLKPMLGALVNCTDWRNDVRRIPQAIEKDAALERRFQPCSSVANVEDTISILRGLKERYEVHHGVRIQDSAVIAAQYFRTAISRTPTARQSYRLDR